ncbi:MAG: phosphate transport system regulatory protein PhoU [Alphaproteobacteria bacterium]|jgi:phosphate transport system protein|nr:phosphate transport system regulatory protein PhoU [Candidatus Fonsibacter sp. PEL55]
MSEHIVSSYEGQLKTLHSTVLKMGALCESQFSNSIIALIKKDEELIDKIIGKDERIDELEKKIDDQVVNLITLRQPMAIDLRETVSAMRIAAELERIGDLAKNIVKRVKYIKVDLNNADFSLIKTASELVQNNLKKTLDSYSKKDEQLALSVWNSDKEIDVIINKLLEDFLNNMKKEKKNIESLTHLLFVAKNIERIGDHSTNICEYVYFLIKGEEIKGNRPKG